jgi:hypothetical protein
VLVYKISTGVGVTFNGAAPMGCFLARRAQFMDGIAKSWNDKDMPLLLVISRETSK